MLHSGYGLHLLDNHKSIHISILMIMDHCKTKLMKSSLDNKGDPAMKQALVQNGIYVVIYLQTLLLVIYNICTPDHLKNHYIKQPICKVNYHEESCSKFSILCIHAYIYRLLERSPT